MGQEDRHALGTHTCSRHSRVGVWDSVMPRTMGVTGRWPEADLTDSRQFASDDSFPVNLKSTLSKHRSTPAWSRNSSTSREKCDRFMVEAAARFTWLAYGIEKTRVRAAQVS